MSGWGWARVAVACVATACVLAMPGLTTGQVYGRFVVAQALAERRAPVLDGYLDGVWDLERADWRQFVGRLDGHYLLVEAPANTVATVALYGLTAWPAAVWPGDGWAPLAVGALGPLALFLALAGVLALARRRGLGPGVALGTVVGTLLLLPSATQVVEGVGGLVVATAGVWLFAWHGGPERRGRALVRGGLAGLVVGAAPWLAPAVLALLCPADRRGWLWPSLGAAPVLALTALYQWLAFGRPWRLPGLLADGGLHLGGQLLGVAAFGSLVLVLAVWVWQWRSMDRTLRVVAPLWVAGALLGPAVSGADGVVLLLPVYAVAVLPVAAALADRSEPVRRAVAAAATLGWLLVEGLAWLRVLPPAEPLVSFGLAQRLAVVSAIAVLASWPLWPRIVRRTMPYGVGLAALAGVLVSTPPATPERSLVPPFSVEAASGGPPFTPWRLGGAAKLEVGGLVLADGAAWVESPLVAARPGERYCAAPRGDGSNLALRWEDDRKHVLEVNGGRTGAGRLCFAAPLGATGVRLRLSGPARLEQAALWSDGVRVAPLPDYAEAALAFSFDWESAMGGLVHSKGGAAGYEGEAVIGGREEGANPLAVAEERGLRMRRGAEILAALFAQYDVRATFYSTGYNLLTGNPDRRTFAGNPTYRWPSPRNGWGSDYWLTHPWFGDDPYASEVAAPAWYFGSVTRALAAAGHEIASHTFGHLYVRGTSPDELATDLAEWAAAAKALGVPPATSFAFPWRSSNSVHAPHFDRLRQAGYSVLIRVYQLRPGHEFELDAYDEAPDLLVMPDTIMPSSDQGLQRARRLVDEVLVRRGLQSLWTHPEEVVDPPQVAAWREAIAYAAAARGRGLWVAPVGEIVARVRASREVSAVVVRDGRVATLHTRQTGATPLVGQVVEVAGARGWRSLAGEDDVHGNRVRLSIPPAGDFTTTRLVSAAGVE